MGKRKSIYPLPEATCAVCGKIFIPAPEHAYKDKRAPYKRVCSWSCVCKSKRLKEAAKQARLKKG